jgi:signal transduction histidine kinase
VNRLAEEQAALRRIATLVARGVPPEEVFAAVTAEVVRVLPVDLARMGRYEPDGTILFVAASDETGGAFPPGTRLALGGKNVSTMVAQTGRPARIESYGDASGPIGVAARGSGLQASLGTPIIVEGRLWGVMAAASSGAEPLPADTGARLADFTELLATAIANAENCAALSRLADEQAALRRVATLVARGSPPDEVFAAVTAEVGELVPVDYAALGRYESEGALTYVAAWSRTGHPFPPVGTRVFLGGENVSTMVFETGRPARIDRYAEASGPLALATRQEGVRSALGTPITVEGHLWGMMAVGSRLDQPLPADTEGRLASFTELVATAIANAESGAALTASRARIVAAADETRRRIQRDLHDGIQQRLVSLMLELRAAVDADPVETEELQTKMALIVGGLAGVLGELREISQGIHPAILSKGGLEHALRALARRSAVPVALNIRAEQRLPESVEVAAYYAVSESLTNAAKHAHASAVSVDLEAHGSILQLSIRDDGIGGAEPELGSGLLGLSDRIEALGGRLQLKSPAGHGTTVLIEVPFEPRDARGRPTVASASSSQQATQLDEPGVNGHGNGDTR